MGCLFFPPASHFLQIGMGKINVECLMDFTQARHFCPSCLYVKGNSLLTLPQTQLELFYFLTQPVLILNIVRRKKVHLYIYLKKTKNSSSLLFFSHLILPFAHVV